MACPYFYPTVRRDRTIGFRAPLGALYDGMCHANAERPVAAEGSMVETACNFGYGSQACSRMPADPIADAVRFSLLRQAGAPAGLLCILEADHAPKTHLQWVRGMFIGPIDRQAEVFERNLSGWMPAAG